MVKEKNCPLKFTASLAEKADSIGWYCDREDCAWWNYLTKDCAILVISMGAMNIPNVEGKP